MNLPDIFESAQLSYLVESVMSLSCWIDAETWLRIAEKRTGENHTMIINSYGLLENPNIYLISYAKLITYQETIMTNMQNIMKYSTKRNYKYVPFQEAFPWLQWTCLVPHLHRAPTSLLSFSYTYLLLLGNLEKHQTLILLDVFLLDMLKIKHPSKQSNLVPYTLNFSKNETFDKNIAIGRSRIWYFFKNHFRSFLLHT